jgi:glycosyltransferase involved in cell wall biosynthesis
LRAAGVEAIVSPGLSAREYAFFWGNKRRETGKALAILGCTAAKRVFDLLRVHHFDVVVIQRNILSTFIPFFELWLCRHHPAVMFDFDDLIISPKFASIIKRNGQGLSSSLLRNRMDLVVRAARQVVVGSPFLKECTVPLNPRVELIPTPVDLRHYTLRPAPTGKGPVVIGWKGGIDTSVYLHSLRPVLDRLARRYGDKIKVVVHGNSYFQPFGPYMEVRPFDLATEIQELHRFDIGLMPLFDDDFTRGKCAFKALEYMAAGVPSISSPVGFICDIVQDGVNGFLASSQEEWFEKLTRLIESPELRSSFAAEGRRTVEARFSIEAQGPRLLAVLQRTGAAEGS